MNTNFEESQHSPICVFSLDELGINQSQYINYLKPFFFHLEWDYYLYRQRKLEYLIKTLLLDTRTDQGLISLFHSYYRGEVEITALENLIQRLNSKQNQEFSCIKPTRRRAIQSFEVSCSTSGITIQQITNKGFNQETALVPEKVRDWRKIERIFKDAPSAMVTDELICIIKALVNKLSIYHPALKSILVHVHFTQIVAEPNGTATNAPEGIHQDGMDYIVSALVIDRQNVKGGRSIICYGDDIRNTCFETILYPGYGILQPDKGTNLWHTVESITSLDQEMSAYRSTIGFDFEFQLS